jgi:hypothetical protein
VEVFVCGSGSFLFFLLDLYFSYSTKRKNNVLLVGGTKTVTKNKTEGLAQGKGKKDRASLEVREAGIF